MVHMRVVDCISEWCKQEGFDAHIDAHASYVNICIDPIYKISVIIYENGRTYVANDRFIISDVKNFDVGDPGFFDSFREFIECSG